jgi:hypothetical protein
MALYRNVRPLLMDQSAERDTALGDAEAHLKRRGIVQSGDIYAITCGEPMGAPGGTNMLKICRVLNATVATDTYRRTETLPTALSCVSGWMFTSRRASFAAHQSWCFSTAAAGLRVSGPTTALSAKPWLRRASSP